MPRFVILTHDWPKLHWDFLVEAGSVLRAWRLLSEPCAGIDIVAEPNFDHRLLYLDYEGPVSGNRGTVRRWDAGIFEWEQEGSASIVIRLEGRRLQGRAMLKRITGDRWEFGGASVVREECEVDPRANRSQQQEPEDPKQTA